MDFDLIVVGGGISGVALAWRAAERGLNVGLFEKNTICSATSNNSLRIMHGGIRYLQNFDLQRVIRSARDQHFMLKRWPKLFEQLPCVMGLKRYSLRGVCAVSAALLTYRAIQKAIGTVGFQPGRILSATEAEREIPFLKGHVGDGAMLWYDVLLKDPSALSNTLVAEAKANGAQFFEQSEVVEISNVPDSPRVILNDREYSARYVVNATGPWVDTIKDGTPKFSNGWCKCFNLVLDRSFEDKYGIGLSSRSGRLLFLVPRGRNSVLGTSNVSTESFSDSQLSAQVSEEEVAEFLKIFSDVVPQCRISLRNVCLVECGLLPMQGFIQLRNGTLEPLLYSNHRLVRYSSYFKLLSTKYTTFCSQADEVLSKLGHPNFN